ncbi:ABC transporter substrate binding protein [Mesorhizobium sp. WSM4904]|uniref:ABC transporter substrate binding protein n=1 Tax=Mesorhizobium sp. WSM4904 TaxID=3038545 RepID=UPI0024187175|nr:ABC transporter substrate binding protein [Mesorhizobium sp. WSM4904]WFP60615.1 ABC transporter substrate binding protein [Mesorhizobium sp. WSM4904]
MLKKVVPGLRCLAVLGDAGVPDILPRLSKAAAEAEGLDICIRLLGREEDLEAAFVAFAVAGAGGLLCLEVPRTTTYGAMIVEMANAARLPAIFGRDHARYGPLMAYGTSLAFAARRMASQVDTVLNGTDAGTLPVEYVRRPELIVNLNAARRMAITLPDNFLRSANEIVG